MGTYVVPAATVVVPQQNQVVFTSSQTWTVPPTAQYVDVMVVGGGSGARGGYRSTGANYAGGNGGAITIMKDIYLGGTGTVSIVVGSGSNGTSGSSTTSVATSPSNAGYSGFGTYCYSSGAGGNAGNSVGQPGSKIAASNGTITNFQNDTTFSDYAPALVYGVDSGVGAISSILGTGASLTVAWGINAFGAFGGYVGQQNTGNNVYAGTTPGLGYSGNTPNAVVTTNTIAAAMLGNIATFGIGTATAGTSGTGGGAGGAAGITGLAGGGGGLITTAGQVGAQGGPGAGGGGSFPNPVGSTGGNGGNAGTNTGAGGGAGANTGSVSAGTGGTGGNGAAGIVVVRWIG